MAAGSKEYTPLVQNPAMMLEGEIAFAQACEKRALKWNLTRIFLKERMTNTGIIEDQTLNSPATEACVLCGAANRAL